MSIPLTILPPVSLPNLLVPGISSIKRKRSPQIEVGDNREAEIKKYEDSSETETDEEFFCKTKGKIEELIIQDCFHKREHNCKIAERHRIKRKYEQSLIENSIKLNKDFHSNIERIFSINSSDIVNKLETFPESYRLILSKIIHANAEINQRLTEIDEEKKANEQKLCKKFPKNKFKKNTSSLTAKELNAISAARYRQKKSDQKALDIETMKAYKQFHSIVTSTLFEENTMILLGQGIKTTPEAEFCYYALEKLVKQVMH